MQTVSIFTLVGASHCVLLAIVCYLQPANRKASDRILTAILVLEGLRLYSVMAITEELHAEFWSYGQNFRLLIGPLFYLYTLSMIGKRVAWSAKTTPHFLPWLLITLLIFANHWASNPIPRDNMTYLVGFTNGLILISYGAASWSQVRKYKKRLKRTHSAVEQINLNWLRGLCLYIAAMGIALILAVVYLLLRPSDYTFYGTVIFSTITTMALCYVISLKGIQQARVYERLLLEELERNDPGRHSVEVSSTKPVEKYKSSAMSKEEAEHFYQMLLNVMKTEQLYLRPKLKLAELAGEVGLHPQQASQVINQCAHISFYDFVNNYRVEEAVKLLREGKLSILDIGAQAGFNSSATFYKHFRRQTGQSPKRYIRELAA